MPAGKWELEGFVRWVLAAILSIALVPFAAADITTVRCDEPTGFRINVADDGKPSAPDTDRFSGVRPLFLFDSDKPGKALVIFGDSKMLGEIRPDAATPVPALHFDDRLVVLEDLGREFWTYSLLPSSGVGVFTRSGRGSFGETFGAVYAARCTFVSTTTLPKDEPSKSKTD